MNKFIINSKLPSLNEWVSANRINKYVGAKFKKRVQGIVGESIKTARAQKTLYSPNKPVVVKFTWHERTKRRDADNVASAKKFILDAMVEQGILKDDSRKYVRGFYDSVVDDNKDYVEVELLEVE